MKILKYGLYAVALILINNMLNMTAAAQAVSSTQNGTITQLWTGWYYDTIGVIMPGPIANPGNCPNTEMYKTDSSVADSVNEKATLITSRINGTPLTLFIQGCSYEGFPRIISVVP